ncbi:hypothetical protein CAPTEDRAFT_192264 [Capitella teleta]|uniref:Uncharacterized protein n=1 Tax=Capitella teleta TaxID=283909 RepID=R7VGZ2_CAPTE|nr:hypothetical protein CAPTEDRAFT_192264 [Capitella teleta]|eukprot:ELU17879.1 hypothetical protein CAPTEDRAFT_192264 [Capitella teleta]
MKNLLWALLLLPLCHSIDLSYNNLVHVPTDIARNETEILINHNLITTIEAGAFSGFDALTLIHLEANALTSIDKHAFVNSTIKTINMSWNKFTKFPYFDQNTLQELNVPYNSIKDFDLHRVLKMNPNVFSLSVHHNKIQSLRVNCTQQTSAVDFIKNQSALTYLHISDNEMDYVEPEVLSRLSKLRYLILPTNRLNFSIWCDYINGTPTAIVDLGKNQVTQFPDFRCIALTLTQLKLANNMISTLNPASIEKLTNLETLDLTNNAITHMDGTSILSLLLSGNPLKCDCRWEWLFLPVEAWREIRERMVPSEEAACLAGHLGHMPWANLTFSKMCPCEYSDRHLYIYVSYKVPLRIIDEEEDKEWPAITSSKCGQNNVLPRTVKGSENWYMHHGTYRMCNGDFSCLSGHTFECLCGIMAANMDYETRKFVWDEYYDSCLAEEKDQNEQLVHELCDKLNFQPKSVSMERVGRKTNDATRQRLLKVTFSTQFEAHSFRARYDQEKKTNGDDIPNLCMRPGRSKEDQAMFKRLINDAHKLNKDARNKQQDVSFSVRDNESIWKFTKKEDETWVKNGPWTWETEHEHKC